MQVIEIPESFTPETLARFMLDHIFTDDMVAVWDQDDWVRLRTEYKQSAGTIRAGFAERGAECGTTGCVAGWVSILTVDPAMVIESGSGFVLTSPGDDFSYRRPQDIAQQALGLTDFQADWLFSANRTQEHVEAALNKIADGHYYWHPADIGRD